MFTNGSVWDGIRGHWYSEILLVSEVGLVKCVVVKYEVQCVELNWH